MIEKFSHVGIVVRDIDTALAFWRDALGLRVAESFEVPEEGVRNVYLTVDGTIGLGGGIELIQPTDPRDLSFPISRRLAEQGDGVFHVAFRVSSASAAASRLEGAGMAPVPLGPAGPEPHPRIVVHPRDANGVLVELLANDADPG